MDESFIIHFTHAHIFAPTIHNAKVGFFFFFLKNGSMSMMKLSYPILSFWISNVRDTANSFNNLFHLFIYQLIEMIGTEHNRNMYSKILPFEIHPWNWMSWCTMHPFHSQNGIAIQNSVSLLANLEGGNYSYKGITHNVLYYYRCSLLLTKFECFAEHFTEWPMYQKKMRTFEIQKRTFYMPVKRMYTKAYNIHFVTTNCWKSFIISFHRSIHTNCLNRM